MDVKDLPRYTVTVISKDHIEDFEDVRVWGVYDEPVPHIFLAYGIEEDSEKVFLNWASVIGFKVEEVSE